MQRLLVDTKLLKKILNQKGILINQRSWYLSCHQYAADRSKFYKRWMIFPLPFQFIFKIIRLTDLNSFFFVLWRKPHNLRRLHLKRSEQRFNSTIWMTVVTDRSKVMKKQSLIVKEKNMMIGLYKHLCPNYN